MRSGLAWLGSCFCLVIAASCTSGAAMPSPDGGVRDARGADAASRNGALDVGMLDARGPRPRRVLFVGNSYTHFNDLPSVVQALSAGRDDVAPLEVESVIVDGATLWDHWTMTGARERIENGAFDVVVLQAQSTETIRDARGDTTGYYFAARFLSEAATTHGARVVAFVTWARRDGHPDYARLRLGDAMTMTGDLENTTQGGQHASVGLAFQIALGELPAVNLYADDGSHPSAAGSFLAACVLSEIVSGEYPRVPPHVPLGLDRGVADALCAIAPRVACPFGTSFCHGACVRTDSDPLNCGACDAACPANLPCTAGVCACPYPEWSPCPGHSCANLGLDRYNCGTCGHACEAGQECRAGACACLSMAEVTVPSIAARRPGCVAGSPTLDADCAAAIAEYCGSLGCFQTGVPNTPFPAMAPYATCLSGDPLTSTFAALGAFEPGCSGPDVAYGPACATAIHRACVAGGAVSGLAAHASAAIGMTMTCVRRATVVRTTFTDLNAGSGFCDGTTTRSGAGCSLVSSMMCRRMGHAVGFGPVAAMGDDVDIVCIDR